MADQIDKLLDRLPIFDGSGRRRFVAGGIILIGTAVLNWQSLQQMADIRLGEVLTSPTLMFSALLLVYAIGSLTEMLGELFLIRAASGIFWALTFPTRKIKYNNKALRLMTRAILSIFVPLLCLLFCLYGFMGRTNYIINMKGLLSERAQKIYAALPDKVVAGLCMPVGDDTEFAIKFLIDELKTRDDKRWARQLILRAKDVAATITALQVVFFRHSFGRTITNRK